MSRLSKEIWKQAEFNGGYSNKNILVSNLGRLMLMKNGMPVFKKEINYRKSIPLFKNGKERIILVAWVVYYIFKGDYTKDRTEVIDHINNKPYDDRICNLQKISFSENISKDHGKRVKNKNNGLPSYIKKMPSGLYSALHPLKANKYYGGRTIYLGHYDTLEQAIEAKEIAENTDKLFNSINNDKKTVAINKTINEYRNGINAKPIKRDKVGVVNTTKKGKINFIYKHSWYGSYHMQLRGK